jgi:hypothetical protein
MLQRPTIAGAFGAPSSDGATVTARPAAAIASIIIIRPELLRRSG